MYSLIKFTPNSNRTINTTKNGIPEQPRFQTQHHHLKRLSNFFSLTNSRFEAQERIIHHLQLIKKEPTLTSHQLRCERNREHSDKDQSSRTFALRQFERYSNVTNYDSQVTPPKTQEI